MKDLCLLQLHSECNRSNKRGRGDGALLKEHATTKIERERYSVCNVAQERGGGGIAEESGTLLTCKCGGGEGLINFGCVNLRVMVLPKHSLLVGTHTQASKQGVWNDNDGKNWQCAAILYTPEGIATVMMQLFIDSLDNLLSLSLDFGCVWMECFDTTLSLSLVMACFRPS